MKTRWLIAAVACSLIVTRASADSLEDEAQRTAMNTLMRMWLVDSNTDHWIYYSIPPNQFTPVLGQDGPVMRFIEAHHVSWSARSRPLNEADRLNGLEWQGAVIMFAEAAREYDCATGWKPWVNRVTLVTDSLQKQHGEWTGRYQYALNVPTNTSLQQPMLDELPGPNAGPHDGKICANAPPPQVAKPPTNACGIRHNPDGTVSGRACY